MDAIDVHLLLSIRDAERQFFRKELDSLGDMKEATALSATLALIKMKGDLIL